MRNSTAFGIIMILGLLGIGVMHEQVHVAIYKGYGIESEVHYIKYFPSFMTVAEKPCPTETCQLAHDINEVVGYPLIAFYIVLMTALLLLIINTEEQNERHKIYMQTCEETRRTQGE